MKAKNIKLAIGLLGVLVAVKIMACANIVPRDCPSTWVDGYYHTCTLDPSQSSQFNALVDSGGESGYATVCPVWACVYNCPDAFGTGYGGPAAYYGTVQCNGVQIGDCS